MYNVFPIFLWSIAVCCKSQNLIFSLDKAIIKVTNGQTVRVYSNPMLIVSKTVFIYSANPYLGNSACAFIVFQSMYHRSSSSICKRQTDTVSIFTQSHGFKCFICPASIIHPSIKQCTVFVTSPWCPHMLSNGYILAFYWIFSRLCEADCYFFTFLQDCIPYSKKKIYIYN